MFCIAICDDEEILCTQLERFLDSYVEREIIETSTFYSTEKLYEGLSRGEYYDLIFLDIEFQLMNGVDVGKKIRNELKNERTQIVYISAKQEYAMELFAVRPMNFLVKPISAEDVVDNVERAMELAETYDTCFEFKIGPENYRIPYGDIVYFESSDRKIRINTKYEKKEIYGRLNKVEKNAPSNFIRIHQSYLVNRLYITYWKSEEVILKDKISLPISQTYRKKVNKALLQRER
ncbi:MAG: LytTR family DNA-binding domain-containing protein [Anaerovoracaceae bacterium]